MEKIYIKNRKDQKICVLIEQPTEKPKGLAFVMHGRSGIKEQPHTTTFAHAFLENGYTSIRFDTTNTFGESDGSFEDVTLTNFYEDLEDVIFWAKQQSWYQEPFCLAGHSLGAISVALYAEKHPAMVKMIAPISTVVSGKLILDAMGEEEVEQWRKTGWWGEKSISKPGLVKRLKWSHAVDLMKYELISGAGELTMPILMIVGADDTVTPLTHQKIFFDAIKHNEKELHVIAGAPHTFRDPVHLNEINSIFSAWIKKYE